MSATELLLRLLDIERAIGVEEPAIIRQMLFDAQDCVLALQKNVAYQSQQERLGPAMIALLADRDYHKLRMQLMADRL
jgi:hypothetical protein